MPSKPVLFVTRNLPEAVTQRLTAGYEARLNPGDAVLTPEQLLKGAAGADALLVTPTDKLTAELIGKLPASIRMIATFSVGYEHIDVNAAKARGLPVSNTPDVLTDATADIALLLMLGAARRAYEGERAVRDATWKSWSTTYMLGTHMTGKRLGIFGMGRIGQAVARRARAFDLTIAYHNRRRLPAVVEQQLGAVYEPDLDRLLTGCDIISIHCPHTAETDHLLDARRIALMPSHLYLINTARGEIVDEAALIDALEQRRIAGAGLDVFEHEPAIDPRLLALDNVVLLPHMGSATFEGRADTGERVITNIRQWIDGDRPRDQVFEGWV